MDRVSDLFSTSQVQVEEHINLIASVLPRLAEKRSRSGEDKEFPCDDSHLVEDLSTLVSLLRGRLVNKLNANIIVSQP